MMPDEWKSYRDIWETIKRENAEFAQKRLNLTLMDPECTFGYTQDQVAQIMKVRLYEFRQWMTGQTEALCDGEGGCGPHGIITYRQDVERFLLGLPVVD